MAHLKDTYNPHRESSSDFSGMNLDISLETEMNSRISIPSMVSHQELRIDSSSR